MKKEKSINIINKIILYCFVAIIFIVPIYFAAFQENFNIYELNKSLVFRFFLNIIILCSLIKYFFLPVSFNFRKNKIVFFLLFLLFASLVVSTIFSIKLDGSLWGSYNRQQGLYNLLYYLIFFICIILNIKNFKQIKPILLAIILSSIPVCLYGLFQFAGLDPIEWKEGAIATGRIFSTLGQPNLFGQYLIMVIPVSIYVIFFIWKNFYLKLLGGFVFLIQLICLVLTASRSAWLGFLAAFFLFIIYLFVNFFDKRKVKIFFLFIVFLIFSLIFVLKYLNTQPSINFSLSKRFVSIFNTQQGSNKIRLYYWAAAIKEFKNSSLWRKTIGYGPETLMNVFVKDYEVDWGIYEKLNSTPDRAHNEIIDVVLQFGIFGFLTYYLFVFYILFKIGLTINKIELKKRWLAIALISSLIACFIYNLFSFSLIVGYIYFYLFLGLLVVLSNEEDENQAICQLANPIKYLLLISAFAISIFLFYGFDIKRIMADHYFMRAKQAEFKFDCYQSLLNIKKAIIYYPYEDFYKETYIYNGNNCLASIKDEREKLNLFNNIIFFIDSINQKQSFYTTKINIAHSYSIFGNLIDKKYYQLAEAQYRELISINPSITVNYKDFGRMKMWQGDYNEAITLFNQGLKILPDINNKYLNTPHRVLLAKEMIEFYKNLGESHEQLKNYKMAIDYYLKILQLDPYQLAYYKKIADIYYLENNFNKALWYNKRGYMLNPGDYKWPFAIALLFKEMGDIENAKIFANKAFELVPENQEVINFINLINKN